MCRNAAYVLLALISLWFYGYRYVFKNGLWPAAGLKILYVALSLKSLPTTDVGPSLFVNIYRRFEIQNVINLNMCHAPGD